MNKTIDIDKKLFVQYERVYKNAEKISKSLTGFILILLFLMFGFMGNVEFNPNASIKLAIIECGICSILLFILIVIENFYSNLAIEYKTKAYNLYEDLLK